MGGIILVRGHHLPDIHIVSLLGINHPRLGDLISSYTPYMVQAKLETLRTLAENPSALLQITASLDYLCNARCPNQRGSCSDDRAIGIDTIVAETRYGFSMGKTYTSAELFQVLQTKPYRSVRFYIPALGQEKSLLEKFRLRLEGIRVITP